MSGTNKSRQGMRTPGVLAVSCVRLGVLCGLCVAIGCRSEDAGEGSEGKGQRQTQNATSEDRRNQSYRGEDTMRAVSTAPSHPAGQGAVGQPARHVSQLGAQDTLPLVLLWQEGRRTVLDSEKPASQGRKAKEHIEQALPLTSLLGMKSMPELAELRAGKACLEIIYQVPLSLKHGRWSFEISRLSVPLAGHWSQLQLGGPHSQSGEFEAGEYMIIFAEGSHRATAGTRPSRSGRYAFALSQRPEVFIRDIPATQSRGEGADGHTTPSSGEQP